MSGTQVFKERVACRHCPHSIHRERLSIEKRSKWIDNWGSLYGLDGHRHQAVQGWNKNN